MIGLTGQATNLDFALLAMSERCQLPHDAPFSHVIEGEAAGRGTASTSPA
jgi:hypothetical protein